MGRSMFRSRDGGRWLKVEGLTGKVILYRLQDENLLLRDTSRMLCLGSAAAALIHLNVFDRN